MLVGLGVGGEESHCSWWSVQCRAVYISSFSLVISNVVFVVTCVGCLDGISWKSVVSAKSQVL